MSTGPCLCGDICCPSCGPAQGNWQCPVCGRWASEGCDHIDPYSELLKPEYQQQVDDLERKLASEQENKTYLCCVCHQNPVAAEDGYDTCEYCSPRKRL
jgi:hypothetical protein